MSSSATSDQLELLLSFLDDHKDLARGLLRSADGRLRAKRLWQELSQLLNSLGGSIKTVQQWQKVWTDRKHLAKKNAAANRRSAAVTGGGQGSQPLASWEMRVLGIMGEGFGAPETTARVSIFPTINFEDEVASYEAPAEMRANPSSAPQYVEQQAGPSSASQLVEPSDPEDLRVQRPTSRNPMRRHRQSSVAGEISVKLLELEERKIEILQGLREELKGLTAAVKELIEKIPNLS